MEKKYEKTYSLSIDSYNELVEILDLMQNQYRSALYDWQVQITYSPSKYIAIFPEGAKSFLSKELQGKAQECIFPYTVDCFVPVVYRFIEERYIENFLSTGTLQLTTFRRCGKLEDPLREDGNEGLSVIIGKYDNIRIESQIKMGDDTLILCTSLASQYVDKNGEKCKCALEIFDVRGFVDACSKAILAQGYHIKNIFKGPCFYADKKIYGELLNEEMKIIRKDSDATLKEILAIPKRIAGPKIFFQKPLEKSIEMEYRMVWMVYPNPQEESMLIQVDEPHKYARKISL